MTTNTIEQTLRDKYFANEIFCIGDIVEDITTHEQLKILDRGANYVTVATANGVVKKWLNEIKESVAEVISVSDDVSDQNFTILESGQIKLFGYESRNFNRELSEFILEQFQEFDDLYSKHQIVKCLDMAIDESDADRAYALLDKVDNFYKNHKIHAPYIVESMKSDIERRRIAEILAKVAGIEPEKSNYNTVVNAIKALREKYQSRKQWEVLWPFFKLAQESGLSGIAANLPFSFGNLQENDEMLDDIVINALEENFDMLVDDLDLDDIYETFSDDEFSDEMLTEVLSIEDRTKMARKLRQHTPMLAVKRERALSKSASASVLLDRARRLAETMLKRRIFHKAPGDMSRQEKERFEAGAGKRKAVVSKLAQRLVGKVRALQSTRLHHTTTPASHQHAVNVTTGTSAPTGAT